MPYIKKDQRLKFNRAFRDLLILDEGELNYAVCQLFMKFVDCQEGEISYKKINGGLGAIELAKQELIRRVLTGYEHQKIIENGDIFGDFIRKHNIREYSWRAFFGRLAYNLASQSTLALWSTAASGAFTLTQRDLAGPLNIPGKKGNLSND